MEGIARRACERRIEQAAGCFRGSRERAEQDAGGCADHEAGEHAPQGGACMAPELARDGELPASRRCGSAAAQDVPAQARRRTAASQRSARGRGRKKPRRTRQSGRGALPGSRRSRESGGCLGGGPGLAEALPSRRSPVHRTSASPRWRSGGRCRLSTAALTSVVGWHDARFLQARDRRRGSCRLRLADGRMGQFGALKLAIDDGLGELGVSRRETSSARPGWQASRRGPPRRL